MRYIGSVFLTVIGNLWNGASGRLIADGILSTQKSLHVWNILSGVVLVVTAIVPYALILGVYLF